MVEDNSMHSYIIPQSWHIANIYRDALNKLFLRIKDYYMTWLHKIIYNDIKKFWLTRKFSTL